MSSRSSKSQLSLSLNAFGAELRSFVQRASDSITALKRTAKQRPQAGVQDFKECLDDLEQQVADFTDEVQQLAQYTSQSISFEELIGHCSAVYRVNRATALALEQHLAQYGYQRPADAVLEPESLQECMQEETDTLFAEEFTAFTARTRQACSTPTSPVSKGSMSMLRSNAAAGHVPSRLGRSQPGSPTSAYAATLGAGVGLTDTSQLRDAAPFSTLRGGMGGAQGMAGVPQTQLRQQQQGRTSFGSNTSSTPAGLMISPSVAALASKYATSSVGGSSVGGMSLPEQPSTGGPSTDDRPRRSPCRDLNLSYSLADTTSPDLPIFGRPSATPPTIAVPPATAAGQQVQQQQLMQTPPAQRPVHVHEEDSTGELYSSLIHSNMQGMGRRGAEASTPDMEVTPPCTRAGMSPCGSPHAPATAGRLPPTWVSEKMQQLEDLQADVTLTLSQMKRCPSRSRTSTPVPGSDSDDDREQHTAPGPAQQQQRRQSQQQQQQQQLQQKSRGADREPQAVAAVQPKACQQEQQVAAAGMQGASSLPTASAAAATTAAAAVLPAKQYRSSRTPGGDSLTAAAAAASADLESLMASLSMKYALGGEGTASAGVDAGSSGAGSAQEESALAGMDVECGPPSPGSPVTPADSTPVAHLAKQYAASTHEHHDYHHQQQQQLQEHAGVGGSTLLTPATQQTIRRIVALGGTAARPQSSIRRAQPTTDVHRLEEIRGFYQTGIVVPQQLDARLASEAPAAHAAPTSSTQATSAAEVAATEPEHAVLRPVQLQEHTAAVAGADAAIGNATAAAGLRQSKQRQQQQQQQEKPKQQYSAQHQQPLAESLTPRAARLQRRLQLQQQQATQQQQQDTENTCPASIATKGAAGSTTASLDSASCGSASAGSAGTVKVQGITAEEFGQLPSWCRSLLSVDVLNGVLQQLSGMMAGRSKADSQACEGFTADDVAQLGHSGSKSKTIVSCLHKLGRASLQRSVTGGSVYKLVGSS